MSTIATSHIKRDPHGVAWINDTNVKVIEVVLDRLAYGWNPEIHFASSTRIFCSRRSTRLKARRLLSATESGTGPDGRR